MRLVVLGPPGSGKGTQSKRIIEHFGIPQISTGDILRQSAKEGTELGDKARVYMQKGELVPDDLMAELVVKRLDQRDCQSGFVLDGFPRTIAQAKALDDLLNEKRMILDAVLELKVDDEAVIKRLSNRRLCSRCGSDYNLLNNPPKREGVCERCGGNLYQREDDKEETIAHRLRIYQLQTQPLETYYGNKGILLVFDAGINVDELSSVIRNALESLPSAHRTEDIT